MRHEERDALSADIYDLLSEGISPVIHLVPRQKAAVRDLMVKFIEDRYHQEDIEYQYKNEDCPHDYLLAKCTGCGYEAG